MDRTANPSRNEFHDTYMNNDEPIMTEMDLESNYRGLANKNLAASRQFLQKNVSRDVLTDYDIMDEVGAFQNTVRANSRQIEFRDKDHVDPTHEDRDIEDLRAKYPPQTIPDNKQETNMASPTVAYELKESFKNLQSSNHPSSAISKDCVTPAQ